MNTKNIQITIAGEAGAGKSIITQLIVDALHSAGIDTSVHPLPDGFYYASTETLGNILATNKFKVDITLQQTRKP